MPDVTSSCSFSRSLTLPQPVPQKALPVLDSASLPFEITKSLVTSQRPSSLAIAAASEAVKALKLYCRSSPAHPATASRADPQSPLASVSSVNVSSPYDRSPYGASAPQAASSVPAQMHQNA